MARRLQWLGCRVHAVVEIMPYPSGLTRNIVQCLNDFSIPLYLGHVVSRIHGTDRVEGVDVTPIRTARRSPPGQFHIPCDTILLSVGLIPGERAVQDGGGCDGTRDRRARRGLDNDDLRGRDLCDGKRPARP